MMDGKINWETMTNHEKMKLDELSEITASIRLRIAAYLKTPSNQSDRHVFGEEIRIIAHEIENWVDDYGRVV